MDNKQILLTEIGHFLLNELNSSNEIRGLVALRAVLRLISTSSDTRQEVEAYKNSIVDFILQFKPESEAFKTGVKILSLLPISDCDHLLYFPLVLKSTYTLNAKCIARAFKLIPKTTFYDLLMIQHPEYRISWLFSQDTELKKYGIRRFSRYCDEYPKDHPLNIEANKVLSLVNFV
jgi:hypothetical protein